MAMAMAIAAALDSIGMTGNIHSLIVGYNFEPSDQSLLGDFLFNKIHGYEYLQGPVSDCDLYGHSEPWEIWESFGGVDGEDLYFFTKLKRSTNNSGQLSAHITRKIGLAGGSWSGENTPDSIFSTKYQRDFGYCKRFRYENDRLPEHHAEWIMHEYSLHEDWILEGADPNYVLCRIRKNERHNKKGKKRCYSETSQPVEQPIMASKTIYKLPCRRKITTNQGTSDHVPCIPTSQDTSNVPWVLTNQDTTDVPYILANQDTSDVPWVPADQDTSDVLSIPEMTTNQDTSNVPWILEMTTNQDNSNVPSIPEMTNNNQDTNDVFWVPKMATHEEMSDVFFLPQIANYEDMIDVFDLPATPIGHDTNDVSNMPMNTTNEGTSSTSLPDMTTNEVTSDMFYLLEMTATNEGASDVFYGLDTTTNQEANNMSETIDDKETVLEKWKAHLNIDSLDDLVDF